MWEVTESKAILLKKSPRKSEQTKKDIEAVKGTQAKNL